MEHYREHFTASVRQYADDEQKSLEDYLADRGFTMAEFEEKREDYAETSCRMDLMVFTLAKKEGIGATDEQIAALIRGLYDNSEAFSSVADMIEYYKSVYGPLYFENRVVSTAVMDLVRRSAVMD